MEAETGVVATAEAGAKTETEKETGPGVGC